MDIEATIENFIKEHFLKDGSNKNINDSISFIEEGIIDSVGVMELVAFLEETFGFRVEDEELIPENLDSLGKLVYYVQVKIGVDKSQESPRNM